MMSSASARVESRITGTSRGCGDCLSDRHSSYPVMRGISISEITTSGLASRASLQSGFTIRGDAHPEPGAH